VRSVVAALYDRSGLGRLETFLKSTAALAHHVRNRVISATACAVVVEHFFAGLEELPKILCGVVSHDH